MRADRFRPQSAIRMKGALSADGKLEAVHIESACGSIQRSANPSAAANGIDGTAIDGIGPAVPYNKVPHWYTGLLLKNTHIPVSYWRSAGGSQSCVYMESLIDELAHAAGKDPVEFRRGLTDRPDSLSVLNKLEQMSNWHSKLPPGQGRGISVVGSHRGNGRPL